jgi:hypothetical protein
LSTLPNGNTIDENYQKFKQPFRIDSFFYQGGAGVNIIYQEELILTRVCILFQVMMNLMEEEKRLMEFTIK